MANHTDLKLAFLEEDNIYSPCDTCDGTGMLVDQDCPDCNGMAVIITEEFPEEDYLDDYIISHIVDGRSIFYQDPRQ